MVGNQQEITLSSKTLIFWKLSQIWNGKRAVEVETGDAIEICTELKGMIGPQRPLLHSVGNLLQEIIDGEGKKSDETKVLPFEKPIRTKKKARS